MKISERVAVLLMRFNGEKVPYKAIVRDGLPFSL